MLTVKTNHSRKAVRVLMALALTATLAFSIIGASRARTDPGKHDPQTRFDYLVRADLFAGMQGDSVRFQRAMKLCEDTLTKRPNFPEALVWHGTGLIFASGKYFQSGDQQRGMAIWDQGLHEMDTAVSMEPDNLGVVIPRGAALMNASAFVPGEYGKLLLQQAVGDFEHVYALQQPHITLLTSHARGELLGGLADGYHRLGNEKKSHEFFAKIEQLCAGTPYAEIAKAWLAEGKSYESPTCQGCHVE